jgi:hypothetical protein
MQRIDKLARCIRVNGAQGFADRYLIAEPDVKLDTCGLRFGRAGKFCKLCDPAIVDLGNRTRALGADDMPVP